MNSDAFIIAAGFFIAAVVLIFTVTLSNSDLFSNRWVTNRGLKNFLSVEWIKLGRAHQSIFGGLLALALVDGSGHGAFQEQKFDRVFKLPDQHHPLVELKQKRASVIRQLHFNSP